MKLRSRDFFGCFFLKNCVLLIHDPYTFRKILTKPFKIYIWVVALILLSFRVKDIQRNHVTSILSCADYNLCKAPPCSIMSYQGVLKGSLFLPKTRYNKTVYCSQVVFIKIGVPNDQKTLDEAYGEKTDSTLFCSWNEKLYEHLLLSLSVV